MSSAKRNSILCPNCNKLISKDEESCPYCGTARPGSWLKNNPLVQGLFKEDGLIKALITVNVTFYVVSLAMSMMANPEYIKQMVSGGLFSLFAPGSGVLYMLGMSGTGPMAQGHWWSLLSANYLHGSLLHIGFNMYALMQLGPLVLEEYGTHRFVTIYTVGGVAGFAASVYLHHTPFTLGASASLCALIGAVLFFGHKRGGTYGKELFKQAGGWVLWLAIFGALSSGIDNWAHGGGLVGGIIIAALLGYKQRVADKLYHKMLSAACVLATAGTLVWVLIYTLMALSKARS